MNREFVVIESGKSRSKFDLLNAAIEKAQFRELLEKVTAKSGKTKAEFLVVIKPNLAMFFKEEVTGTDPELVEHLVDLLHDLSYTNVVIGEAQNTFYKWLHNREIPNIARAIGYKFTTPKGRKYQVHDLASDLIPCNFPPEYSLFGTPVSKIWQEADFRINFAKNKTHEEYFYTLCLKNLLGALPLDDKHLHYHSRLKVWDVCLEVYQQFPVHFNIIDAYVSNHGNVGSQVLNAIETWTVIAGYNGILVDWIGAIKMGIDPYLSPLNRKALKQIGLPENYQVIGSLTPYEGWKNVHPLISDSFLRLDEAEAITRIFWPASFIVDRQVFPWKKKLDKWINAIISPFWTRVDRNRLFLWLIIYMNYFFVWVFFMKRVWRTLINQKQLRRKELPINVVRDQFKEQDYEGLPAFMRPLEEIINSIPTKNGSCHTFVDGAILHYLERDVDFPFEEFVSKVEIRKTVSYMHDYIGGRTVQIKSDSEGRCIHQLERTVFLSQPNSFILFNGSNIDVTKIEWIKYSEGFQKIIWRTVFSDNNSAIYDDGTVTFEQLDNRIRIRIIVHQNFVKPPALNWIKLNNFPSLRRFFMVPGYHHFFKKTIDNYCSVAEGKYEAIGRPWITD
ncbi:DUF362 domain-containing protein [candidate division KSB1 bacterium]|nr:DUF362 domain-containing protein [candidate division KSB1 bacterium]